MRSLLIPFILTIICCAGNLPACAQTFPVQSNVQFIPPYSLYLSDYAIAGQEKILVQLLLKDITVNHYRVKLKLKIEGVGITIATPENFSGPPISLQGGAPLTLTAFELAPYFNLRNLQFAGLNKSDFQRTGRLPEGVYKFTIEVYDFNRTKQVAAPASAMAWIVLNDPPFVNLPVNNHKVTNILPQFIAFQWTPRHMGSPNSAFSTEYVFKLVEIWPIERNPNDAMLSQRPIYETTTHQTQIVFGPAEPQLIPGRKYAWQVTARDTQKRDLFKNQGRSEVYMFQFGDACNAPKNVKVVSQGSTYLRTSWNSDPVHQNYSLQYREKGQKEWYGQTTISTQASISSLKPGVTYEYQVQAGCGQISSDYSPVLTATTLEENKSEFVCGSPSVPQQIIPGEPLLQILGINDVIYYHNYEVRVKEITSASNGVYSGNAIALIPYLNYAHVKMTFKNIRVTQTYKVVSGEMESVWDPDSEWVYYDESQSSDNEESNPATEETEDSTGVTPPEDVITINFDGVIDSVYVNDDGDIVVVDTEGNVTTNTEIKTVLDDDLKKTVVIEDQNGTQYVVENKNGQTRVTKVEDGAGGSTITQGDPIKDRVIALILEQFKEEIAVWLRDHGKGPLDDEVYKLILSLQNFPEDAEMLEYIHDIGIPYFEQHASELTEKIETVEDNKQLLDRVSELFSNSDEIDWNKISEGDQETLRTAIAEELMLDWWENLPYWKRAAKILAEHLDATNVYENIARTCDASQCIITADLRLGEEITYMMEVTINSSMSADALFSMLMFEYHVDYWVSSNVTAEDVWDELYHWWRKLDDDLIQHKGWQVSMLNFMADVYTAPTMVPAVQGWITGKHWRDGHDLAGWEQALAALDFLVAEEMVKGCITNFVVRVGTKTVNLLRLKDGTKYLVQKSIEKGLKFSVLANDEVTILSKEGHVVGRIVGEVLTIPYTKYGGTIVCQVHKTTTVIGKYIDLVDGDGIKIIKENKLYKYGENVGGVNILDDANWSWPINENWLREAVQRGDVIRVISDPRDIRNLYKLRDGQFVDAFDNVIKESEVLTKGFLTPFGREIQLLETQLKKKFNPNLFVYE